jgi:fermentation-respiration switch protein FrsA (DUF1100 family)
LIVILFFFQARYVYYPEHVYVDTPKQIGLDYRAVTLTAADGVKLAGWFVPAANPRATILFCHGNAGNISHRLEMLAYFQQLGLSTFIFDYRGYGRSQGKPSEAGTYLDAEAAWQYLTERRKLSPARIIILGESLGGAVAARLARRHPPRALILQSTFTSFADQATVLYPYLPIRWLARYRYDTLESVRCLDCPVFVIHSREDELIPFSQGRRLYTAARGPKMFLAIAGSHNDGISVSAEAYISGVNKFLASILGL